MVEWTEARKGLGTPLSHALWREAVAIELRLLAALELAAAALHPSGSRRWATPGAGAPRAGKNQPSNDDWLRAYA